MANYYLKMDNIMKNMFVVALNEELKAQREQDGHAEETETLLKKVREYDLAEKRLQISDTLPHFAEPCSTPLL